MGRLAKEVCYKKKGKYWYYKLQGENYFRSTGTATKMDAIAFVNVIRFRHNGIICSNDTLRQYAKPFFIWGQCPHATRLINEGKNITKRYLHTHRLLYNKYIEHTSLASQCIKNIKRADILDFRESLKQTNLSFGSINNIMTCLGDIFREAKYREDIEKNPMDDIGCLHSKERETGIFTLEELKKLFFSKPLSIWSDYTGYTCFLIAALTGMRKSEILALRWENINLEQNYIYVCEAWKDSKTELGTPKWGRTRYVSIPQFLHDKLVWYQDYFPIDGSSDLVICSLDGHRFSGTWWDDQFQHALKKAEIHANGRWLKPHSFRHTLNSILRAKGENPEVIRAALGWGSEAIQDNYTHWKPELVQSQGKIVDELMQ